MQQGAGPADPRSPRAVDAGSHGRSATGAHPSSHPGSRRDHGWWPYLLPYMSFLLLVEIGRRTPESAALLMLILKPGVPAALLLLFWRQGRYPELRGFRLAAGVLGDVAVGLASAALWMAPFLLSAGIRDATGVDPSSGFDPDMLGPDAAALALGLRLVGYAAVTPFFEELFIRSFVMRVADVYPGPGDFRDVPVARFTLRSFVVGCLVFTAGHLSWEWPVALLWVAGTNLWFYRRGHVGAVIVVHAVANAAVWAVVVGTGGQWPTGSGDPLPIWFFL